MGGELCVGIRRYGGAEQVSIRWTNEMPFWLCDPSFFEERDALTRFLDRVSLQSGTLPYNTQVDAIEPSEYGVILIDFQSRQILSCQDYTSMQQLIFCSVQSNWPATAESIVALFDRGYVTAVYDCIWFPGGKDEGRLSSREQDELLLFCRQVAQGDAVDPSLLIRKDNFSFTICYRMADLTVAEHDRPTKRIWDIVTRWVDGNGWSTPVKKWKR